MSEQPTKTYFMLPLQLSRQAVDRFSLGSLPFSSSAAEQNLQLLAGALQQPNISSGQLGLLGLLNDIFRQLLRDRPPSLSLPVDLQGCFVTLYPPAPRVPPTELQSWSSERQPWRQNLLLSELLILDVQCRNPAATELKLLFDDRELTDKTGYQTLFEGLPGGDDLPGGISVSLREQLLNPCRNAPDSLADQLEWISRHWGLLLPEELRRRIPFALARRKEELKRTAGGPGPVELPSFRDQDVEPEAFSADADWMPEVVLQAKSVLVWLDQLSSRYQQRIDRLDQIPEAELAELAAAGISGLWLIGLWERSEPSRDIKRRRGNPEAAASAYALYDYVIATDLGGEAAFATLRTRAGVHGIRLCGDLVPNHTGLYSRWVKDQPDWFLQKETPPYVGYRFTGPDLSPDPELSLVIEDGYWDHSEAAVVFQHTDHRNGRIRYLYHGNDGTHLPWNDTAQLDYFKAEVREAMLSTIVGVAKRFPIIRFDAAMTLAKRHFRRLWYPPPGAAGVPSRSNHALTKEEFDRFFPTEFWRQVVDRIAEEAPDTLLIAEAFWLMESYFVRTLGLHRVYNSAFMHLLKQEDNSKFIQMIEEILRFNPEILQRYVNFMNNPDEATAVAQFGKGDKYFAVATLLATLPGLPLIGHGQLEGLEERYGMEYRRAYREEQRDEGFYDHHRSQIFPLLKNRRRFSGAEHFWLFPLRHGTATETDVIAYSNRAEGQRSLVVVHNAPGAVSGQLQNSAPRRVGGEGGRLQQESLATALDLQIDREMYYAWRNQRSGGWRLQASTSLAQDGLWFELVGYQYEIYLDWHPVWDRDGSWADLARHLGTGECEDLNLLRLQLRYNDLHQTLNELLSAPCAGTAEKFYTALGAAIGSRLHPLELTRTWQQAVVPCQDLITTAGRPRFLQTLLLLLQLPVKQRAEFRFADFGLQQMIVQAAQCRGADRLLERLLQRQAEFLSSPSPATCWSKALQTNDLLQPLGLNQWQGEAYLNHEALQLFGEGLLLIRTVTAPMAELRRWRFCFEQILLQGMCEQDRLDKLQQLV